MRVPMLLSAEELAYFGSDANQIKSDFLWSQIKCSREMWKNEYQLVLTIVSSKLAGLSAKDIKHVMVPKLVAISCHPFFTCTCAIILLVLTMVNSKFP